MLANLAANATADIGIAVWSIRAFARCTRRVVARSSTVLPSSRKPRSMGRSARETVAAAPYHRRLHRAGGTAIDPRGQDPGEEPAVEPRVPRDPRAIARTPIEDQACAHGTASLAREPAPVAPRDDDVRKWRDGGSHRR
jgi:hypothetical protein